MALSGFDPPEKRLLQNPKTQAETSKMAADMKKRLEDLNDKICRKIANNFTSVNKAFLTIDQDHDGLINPKDIVSLYGTHIQMEYSDLLKIFEGISSKKDGSGCVNYSDFSRWIGNKIHNLASFVFRHDSRRNPEQERFVKK